MSGRSCSVGRSLCRRVPRAEARASAEARHLPIHTARGMRPDGMRRPPDRRARSNATSSASASSGGIRAMRSCLLLSRLYALGTTLLGVADLVRPRRRSQDRPADAPGGVQGPAAGRRGRAHPVQPGGQGQDTDHRTPSNPDPVGGGGRGSGGRFRSALPGAGAPERVCGAEVRGGVCTSNSPPRAARAAHRDRGGRLGGQRQAVRRTAEDQGEPSGGDDPGVPRRRTRPAPSEPTT